MKTWVNAKIHGIRVTDKSVEYQGSVTICKRLMDAAGIEPYEQVHVINLNNGARWITYAVPGDVGVFTLNGGGARLGEIGDRCVLLTYATREQFIAPFVASKFIGTDAELSQKLTDEQHLRHSEICGARVIHVNPLDNSIDHELRYGTNART